MFAVLPRERYDCLLCVLELIRILPTVLYIQHIQCPCCKYSRGKSTVIPNCEEGGMHKLQKKKKNKVAWMCSAKRNERAHGRKANAMAARTPYYC